MHAACDDGGAAGAKQAIDQSEIYVLTEGVPRLAPRIADSRDGLKLQVAESVLKEGGPMGRVPEPEVSEGELKITR
jgi:hypothetical protein